MSTLTTPATMCLTQEHIASKTPADQAAVCSAIGAAPSITPWSKNFSRANLKATYAGLGRVAQNASNAAASSVGISNLIIDAAGDSLTRSPSDKWFGKVADGDGYTQATAANQRAYHTAMAKGFAAAGYPANTDAVQGCAIFSNLTGFSDSDGLVKFGAGWIITAQDTLGGYFFNNGTDTTPISMKPMKAYDTVEVTYYASNSGSYFGTFTITANGATTSAFGGGTQAVYKVKIPVGAQAAGTIFTLQRTGSGGGLYVLGIRTRLSTLGEVEITNCGRNSGTSGTLNSTAAAYSPKSMLAIRAAHLAIYGMGVNDWNPPNSGTTTPVTSLANYITNTQAFIDAAKLAGSDVLLLAMPESNPAGSGMSSAAVQQTYRDALSVLADTNNCPFIDFKYLWGTWAEACAKGFMAKIDNGSGGLMFDDRHMSLMGANDMGRTIARAILSNAT